MKQLLTLFSFSLHFILIGQSEGLELLAHYPLTEHYGDITGQQDSLDNSGVQFADESLYFDGADPNSDSANQVIFSLEDFDRDLYYISLQVKIDSLRGNAQDQLNRNLFELQAGEEWSSVLLNHFTGTMNLGRLGGVTVLAATFRPDLWYTVGISYDRKTGVRKFYINEIQTNSDTFNLESESILTSFGLGHFKNFWWPFKGSWKNLMFYASFQSIPLSISCTEEQSPSDFDSNNGIASVSLQGGMPPYLVSSSLGDTLFEMSGTYYFPNLISGEYAFHVTDAEGIKDSCVTILAPRDSLEIGRKLLAHYPLEKDYHDITGQETEMYHENVYFTEQGLFIDGANPISDTTNVIYAEIANLDFDDFYISLEVKIDSLEGLARDNPIRHVLTGGLQNIWMDVLENQRLKQLFLAHSVGGGRLSSRYALNQWIKLGLSYNKKEQLGILYINGEAAIEENFELDGSDNRRIGLDIIDRRWPMKGHWKNLKVFGPIGSINLPLSLGCSINHSPSHDSSSDGSIRLEIVGGTAPYDIFWNNELQLVIDSNVVIMHGLNTGRYLIKVIDSLGSLDSCSLELLSQTNPEADRKLLAFYPLDDHLGDITGQEDTLRVEHVLLADDGLYIDGADPRTDTSNRVEVTIEELNLDDFYISLEVNLDSIPDDGVQFINQRNILVGGLGWKWMRFLVNQQFDFITLSTPKRQSPYLPFEFGRWYTFGMYYDRANLEGRFYIDGQLKFILDDLDLRGMEDRKLGIGTNTGSYPMKGHWRNLKIYGPNTRIDPISFSCSENQLPSDENSLDGSILIHLEGGSPPYQLDWNEGDTTITESGEYLISNLGVGTYIFHVTDSLGIQDSCNSSLVFPLSLPLIAHYPLSVDGKDVLGLNDDMVLQNVTFIDSSIYIDGADSFSDTSNNVTASRLNMLNFDHFQVDLEFKLDSISGGIEDRIIWMGGALRWAMLGYNAITREIQVIFENAQSIPINYFVEYGKWYASSVIYNSTTRELSFWIDGTKIYEGITDIEGFSDKQILVDCKCGPRPMKGYWKNLKVYSLPDEITDLELAYQITEWNGIASSEDGAIELNIEGGIAPYKIFLKKNQEVIEEMNSDNSEITFKNLAVDAYLVEVRDALDSVEMIEFELLPPKTDLPIQSYYPFESDLADTSGTHMDMVLSNVQHLEGEGLLLPGNNNNINPIDQIRTVFTELNTDDFYLSLNVTIDSVEDEFSGDRSIFLMGGAWKWMYPVYFQTTQEIKMRYSQILTSPDAFHFEFGKEYEIALSYNKKERTGRLFIDRQQVSADTFDLIRPDQLAFEMNCNCGPRPMKGFWRKLRLYSAMDSMVTSAHHTEVQNYLNIYPNPGSSHIIIESKTNLVKNKFVLWFDVLGRQVKKEMSNGSRQQTFDIAELENGVYWIKIGNVIKKFIKQ